MKSKRPKTIKTLKKRLRKFLPNKIGEVIESYDSFSSNQAPDDSKEFAAYHSACKAAVAHAETLLKIVKWTDEEKQEKLKDASGDINRLIEEARKAVLEEDELLSEQEEI